jgi:hypothetical protein
VPGEFGLARQDGFYHTFGFRDLVELHPVTDDHCRYGSLDILDQTLSKAAFHRSPCVGRNSPEGRESLNHQSRQLLD